MNEQNNQRGFAFCMHCGTKHAIGDKFCGVCGKKIESAAPISQESKNQLLYQQAVSLLAAQKFDEALAIFNKLEDYGDAKEKAQLCISAKANAQKEAIYSYAVAMLKAEKVSEDNIRKTIANLKSIEGYRNSTEVIAKLEELLERCLESQRAAQEAALKRQYFAATSHFKAGAFDEAIKIFTSLGNYSDSKEQIQKCLDAKELARKQALYDRSVAILNASEPTEDALKASVNTLKSIPDFKDSNEKLVQVEMRLEKWYADRNAAIEARRIHMAKVKARRKKILILTISAILIVAIIVAGILFATHPYEIKYDLAGGTFLVENETSYTFITEDFAIINPVREGYTFIGWTGTDIETPIKNLTVSQWSVGNKEFIANWQANDYIVEFALNGGSMDIASMVVKFDSNVELPKPTRTGYTFADWISDDLRVFTDGVWKEASGITLTANWLANNYKITLENVYKVNANSVIYSEGSSIVQTATYDKQFNLLIPTRTGYGFLGWYNGETLIESGIWNIDSDVTLTAKWLANSNTIILNANGGTVSSAYITATYDQAYTLPTPTRTGYTFDGWFSGTTQYVNGTWNELNDVTLVAKWTPNTYNVTYSDTTENHADVNVTFDYNYTGSTPYSVTLANGETLEYPEIPTLSGYLFAGWYTDADCTSIFAFNETITEDITLYAKWVYPSSYTSILSMNGNTGNTYFTSTVKYYPFVSLVDQTITIYTSHSSGDPYIYLYDSNKNRLESDDDGYGGSDSYISYYVTAGTLYYAGFGAYSSGYGYMYLSGIETPTSTATASCGTVSGYVYEAGASSSTTIVYDSSLTLPTPVRTGYTFLGWYNGDTKVESGIWTTASNVTLSPRWEANQNTVTLNANGGTVSSSSITVTYDSAYTLPTPTRTGYAFNGWFNGTTQVESGTWNYTSDLSLTASWTANSYTLTLDVNGGSGVDSSTQTIAYDSAYLLPTPTRTGYTFNGWFNGATQYFSGTWNELNNVTLTASWTVNTYNITYTDVSGSAADITVTFDYNYTGSTPTTVTLTNGETLEYPEIPTLSGYLFAGWYTDADCTTKYDFTGEITEDITLYAGWISTSYTALSPNSSNEVYLYSSSTHYSFVALETGYVTISIGKTGYLNCTTTNDSEYSSITIYCSAGNVYTFYAESYRGYTSSSYTGYTTLSISSTIPTSTATASCGTVSGYVYEAGSSVSTTIEYGAMLTLPSPIRLGYEFLGWYNGSTPVTDGIWNIDSDVVLTAMWEERPNTITLDPNGATLDETSISIVYGEYLTLPTPERTGYTFNGWFNGDTQYVSGTWNGLNDVALTASWTPNTYLITYTDIYETDDAYLYSEGSVLSIYVEFDTMLTLPTPLRPGYAFLGWYDGSTPVTDGIWSNDFGAILTPMWEERPNTITLDGNGIELDETSMSIMYGEYLTLPTPERTGYTFEGWFYEGAEFVSDYWYGIFDITLVAQWTPNTYNIVYSNTLESDDGYVYSEGSDLYTFVVFDYTITLITPVRAGHAFLGWYNGSTPVTDGIWNIDSDVVLTAMWEERPNTITLDGNGLELDETSISIVYNEYLTLPTPERTGYTFEGWFCDGVEYVDGDWLGLSDITLVAEWTPNTYNITYSETTENRGNVTVTFDYNYTGSTPTTVTLTNGETLEYPEIPTLSGYLFAGWYTDDDCTSIFAFNETITEDITLYAKWVYPSSYTSILSMNGNTGSTYFTSTVKYYPFVSLVDQTITLYTSHSSGDPKIYLYDSNKNQLTADDDSYGGRDSYISYYVTAGTLYYAGFGSWSTSSGSGYMYLNGSVTTPTSTATASCGTVLGYIYDEFLSTSTTIEYGATLTLPTPVRAGHAFLGWYNGDTLVTDGIWDMDEDVVLTAMWEERPNTITLDGNGVDLDETSISIVYGEYLTLPTLERTGYTFDGWFCDGVQYVSGDWLGLSDITLVAQWTPNTYNLVLNNTSTTQSYVTVNVVLNYGGDYDTYLYINHGQTLPYFTPDTRSGYVFVGWYTDADCTIPYDFTGTITEDITLYASWVEMPWGSVYTETQIDPTEYESSSICYSLSTDYTSSSSMKHLYIVAQETGTHRIYWKNLHNYDYYGYYLQIYNVTTGECLREVSNTYETSFENIEFECEQGDVISISIYRAHSGYYSTAYFYFEGFEAITSSAVVEKLNWEYSSYYSYIKDVEYGASFTLPELSREGYTFLGWFDEEGNKVESGIWNYDNNVLLTPEWREVGYYNVTFEDVNFDWGLAEITLDYNYSGSTNTVITVNNNDYLEYPEIPTREGYYFTGWYYDSECTRKCDFDFPLIYNSNFTLYAGWDIGYVSMYNVYSWYYDGNYLYSADIGNSESAEYTVEALMPLIVTFDYKTSSEENYDILYIKKNGEILVSCSGSTSYTSYSIELQKGDQLSFVYSKDGSQSHGNDCAYIDNLTYTPNFPTSNSAVVLVIDIVSFVYEEGNQLTGEVALGAEVEMPELTREGYVFLGWYYGDTKLESGIWTIEEDVVLTPRWEPIS